MFARDLFNKFTLPARAGGGINEAYNQIAQDALNRKMLEANALSKEAYANWVGPQSLMAFLQTQGLAQNIGIDKYKELTNLANNMGMQAANRMQGGQGPINSLAGILAWAANKLGFGQQPQSQSPNTFRQPFPGKSGGGGGGSVVNNKSPDTGYTGTTPETTMSDEELKDYFQNVKDNNGYIDPNQTPGTTLQRAFAQGAPVSLPRYTASGMPETSVSKLASGLKTGGEAGGLNQPAIFSAEEAQMKQYGQGQLANILEQQNKIYTADNTRASEAFDQNTLLESMKEEYSRLGKFEKGNWTKIFDKPLSDAAQALDAKTEQLVQSVARNAAVTGHVTDAGRISAAASKTGRKFSDRAFKDLINFASSQNDRIQEKPLFDQTFSKLGYDPMQTEILWRYYNTMKPFYNNKTNEANEDNLLSWDQFYNKNNKVNNLRAAFSPSAQKEINKIYRQKKEQQYSVVSSTGENIGYGNESDVDRFLKENEGYKKVLLK